MAQLVDERTRDLQAANDKLSQEIAERKRAELVKQEFTSTVNHELRTPLTSIKGALGLIRTGTIAPLPDQTLALLDIAYRNGERLEALINDLLDVEKLETGEMVFTLAPLDIRALIDEAIELNQECCEKYDVTFSLGDCAPNAWVEGDRDRLLQVMSNLMSNAAKFSESGKAVEITLATKNGAVRTSVRNYGKVIPKTVGNHIFEKFSQLNTSDNRQVGGTGLGLSIAKSIVEEHSGSIGYHSNATDGTTFYFALPSIDR
ncbi:sensor histidine kinase [Magnetovibrio sp.]|uniref:sensor histidine kinase n=1 Tax=Magnetovibrio sp. TaxID=2024836 RepID=UPI0039C8C6D5